MKRLAIYETTACAAHKVILGYANGVISTLTRLRVAAAVLVLSR